MTQENLIDKLLEQINWPEDQQAYFSAAQLTELVVHELSGRWTFKIQLPDILPFAVFQQFQTQLRATFQDIAQVELTLTTTTPQVTQANLSAYWRYVIAQTGIDSPMITEVCQNQIPELQDQRLILRVDNEIVKSFMEKQALGPIQEAYQQVGFPALRFQIELDDSQVQAKIEELKAKQAAADLAFAQQAAQKAAQQQQRQSVPSAGDEEVAPVIGGGVEPKTPMTTLDQIEQEERNVYVQGYVFASEIRTFNSGRSLLTIEITDYTSSIMIKCFSRKRGNDLAIFEQYKKGVWVRAQGSVENDQFTHELVLNAREMEIFQHPEPQESYQGEQKRVELHLHTNMSQMDATNSIGDFAKRAKSWGQTALALTDHVGAQSFPDAHAASQKYGLKLMYGVEINLVDDGNQVAYNLRDQDALGAEYVIFDVETTGLSAVYDTIIEIGAVRMQDGQVVERYDRFIDPGHPLSATTINLTNITDEMVRSGSSEATVIAEFMDFIGDAVVVGHNVTFDIGFLNAALSRLGRTAVHNPVVDTLEMSRTLHPENANHKLDTLSKRYNIVLEHHHRADSDAEATGLLYYALFKEMNQRFGTTDLNQLNEHVGDGTAWRLSRPHHAILIARTQAGLKNLFKIISSSMVDYFYRVARVPRSLLNRYREGIMVGSACDAGEVFTSMMQKGYEEARQKAMYYDYLEVMPKAVYQPLIQRELINNDAALEDILKNIVKLGDDLGKPVVATGDVHYLDPHDAIYREILIRADKSNPLSRQVLPDVHFLSTAEMLAAFDFLGPEKAQEIVITNTNKVAALVDDGITPVKDKLYTPKMPGAEDEIRTLAMNKAHQLYGDPLPEIVDARVKKELKSIIGNGFSVIYLISQKLVFKSNKDGYLVGSRGSVGSSLVATMTGITEVNPLPPHYRCPQCQYSEFYTQGEYGSGFDLPDKDCPKCGTALIKDGHDIPFETFLGFRGDKVPDIDLNFSGDYQPIAHNYTKVLFGEKYVFRAGTIGTVADRTAYGYVKHYEEVNDLHLRGAELDRLAAGATGVKRTTGQHPAGIIVVPNYMDIYDFTPIQFPADKTDAAWRTTHFDFHSIHDNILKLDILGHDDPTMIRMLQDLSGIDPVTIPTDDPGVLSLFSGTDALGVTPEQINSKTGTLGVPEFGTAFVRGMLEETHPSTFAELLQISGLSHGTDVWLGNAEELINQGVVTLKDVIGCRDNIMMDLIHWGVDSQLSFQIMESVRKGKGMKEEWQDTLRQNDKVPAWYIDSCLKIKYMFPKAHATAYILMALRIAYFKVYFPVIYYTTYFSVRADDYDLVAMSHGKEAVKARMKELNDEINEKGKSRAVKQANLLTVLELANECLERGFEIKMVDIEKSDSENFQILDEHTILAPFKAIPGLGGNVAKQIVAARAERPFLSKEDLATRGKVSKTLIDYLSANGVLNDLPDENQLSLF
ncbi:PolC-type DNA polymerase III [Lapidilactobacillus luobeiensis]|uniref:PolC-type DNA polymerase III n=1 Tax=Lapidilactobacillus luobeiensis TaxID=2950371 RepID=UPI0021C32CD4|nr:PolC-type DNA polymerase III [Lapidilactobacillus luobeiensis]